MSPRIRKLLADLSVEEKIGQLVMVSLGAETIVTGPKAASEPSVEDVRAGRVGSVLNLVGRERIHALQKVAVEESRTKIPLLFGLDVIHGYRTAFPVPLGETAAFRPDLWEKTARVAAEEATDDGIGLTFAPMLDLARDPRWGRIVEGPGEDATVGRAFARAKVAGFQGARLDRPDSLAATAKHFVAYGAVTAGRDYAAVDVSERVLHEVYLPAFEAAVKAGCLAIMPAFVDIAGRPVTGDRALLTELVRERWGFEGIYVSDYDAIGELVAHGVAADKAEAAARALKAGMDLDMMSGAYAEGLPEALRRGLIGLDDIDAAVARVLSAKERLGLFTDPYGRGDPLRLSARPRAERRALAREAAAASMVLATNRGEVLPLARAGGPIALIGPFAERAGEMLGAWSCLGDQEEAVSLAEGVRAAFPNRELVVVEGCGLGRDDVEDDGEAEDDGGIAAAVTAAAGAEVVILAIGEPGSMTGEAASRAQPYLTGLQEELARAVLATGRPVVVVLFCGRPLIEPWLFEAADAVLVAWYPGSEGGHAIADLLVGARSPSGRLPVSWPVDVGQIPIFYGERPTGRPFRPEDHFSTCYLDVPNTPLFPFGHGLGYGRFELGPPQVEPQRFHLGEAVRVGVELANTGAAEAAATVFLFLRDVVASTTRPVLQLARFETATLRAGERRTLAFTLRDEDFALLGPDLAPRVEPGAFEISVGFSADRESLATVTITCVDGAAIA